MTNRETLEWFDILEGMDTAKDLWRVHAFYYRGRQTLPSQLRRRLEKYKDKNLRRLLKGEEMSVLDATTPGFVREVLTQWHQYEVKKTGANELEIGCCKVTREDLVNFLHTIDHTEPEKPVQLKDYVQVRGGGDVGKVVLVRHADLFPGHTHLVEFAHFFRTQSHS